MFTVFRKGGTCLLFGGKVELSTDMQYDLGRVKLGVVGSFVRKVGRGWNTSPLQIF
jgi:hypothetical protein